MQSFKPYNAADHDFYHCQYSRADGQIWANLHLATVSEYARTMFLAIFGPTEMLAPEFGHAGNMRGATRLPCILATVSGCAENISVAVYGPTCMLATVFEFAGTMLLAVYGSTDMLSSEFGHAGNMQWPKGLHTYWPLYLRRDDVKLA